eukprot:jgi/Hompol1/3060/HPOL_000027-RA
MQQPSLFEQHQLSIGLKTLLSLVGGLENGHEALLDKHRETIERLVLAARGTVTRKVDLERFAKVTEKLKGRIPQQ